MANLGKDHRLYGLRSIRQGASTKATETKMPEMFLRTSGGWNGDAMERYRKDHLPKEQAVFAKALGQCTPCHTKKTLRAPAAQDTPFREPVRSNRANVRGSNWVVTVPAVRLPDRGSEPPLVPKFNDVNAHLINKSNLSSVDRIILEARHGKPPGSDSGGVVGGKLTRGESRSW